MTDFSGIVLKGNRKLWSVLLTQHIAHEVGPYGAHTDQEPANGKGRVVWHKGGYHASHQLDHVEYGCRRLTPDSGENKAFLPSGLR